MNSTSDAREKHVCQGGPTENGESETEQEGKVHRLLAINQIDRHRELVEFGALVERRRHPCNLQPECIEMQIRIVSLQWGKVFR